jgi:crotonobetainyl-CoA:carnitine CoA-transferase CaiB-like acyl-CoA transferase
MQNVMFRMQGTPGRIRFAGRRLGQDTETVLSERLGLGADEIAKLREDGAL